MLLLDILIVNGGDNIMDGLVEDILKNDIPSNCRVFMSIQNESMHEKVFKSLGKKHFFGRIKTIYKNDGVPPPGPYNDLLDLSTGAYPQARHCVLLDDDIVIKDRLFLLKMEEHLIKHEHRPMLCVTEHCVQEDGNLTNCCWLINKSIFKEVGYFDENLIGKDAVADFLKRVRLCGHEIDVIPNSMGYFDHIGGVGSKKNPVLQEMLDNSKVNLRSKIYTKSNIFARHRKKHLTPEEIHLSPLVKGKDREKVSIEMKEASHKFHVHRLIE